MTKLNLITLLILSLLQCSCTANTLTSQKQKEINNQFFDEIKNGTLDKTKLEEWISKGGNINLSQDKYGRNPLLEAAWYGQNNIIKLLLQSGADVNAQNSGALVDAAHAAKPYTVWLLLNSGAKVNRKEQTNALMWAAYNINFEIAQMLVQHGAHINATNADGMTALMYATIATKAFDTKEKIEKILKMIELLLINGADLYARDKKGKSAADYAKAIGRPGVSRLLQLPKDVILNETKKIKLTQKNVKEIESEFFEKLLPILFDRMFDQSEIKIKAQNQFKTGRPLRILIEKHPANELELKDFSYIFPISGISKDERQAVQKYNVLQNILIKTKEKMITDATKQFKDDIDGMLKFGVKVSNAYDMLVKVRQKPGQIKKIEKIFRLTPSGKKNTKERV